MCQHAPVVTQGGYPGRWQDVWIRKCIVNLTLVVGLVQFQDIKSIENNTWAHVDMEFLFKCLTQ